jgi:hypothetical protein
MDPITAQLSQSALKQAGTPETIAPKTPNYTTENSAFGQILGNHMDASNSSTQQLINIVENMTGNSEPKMNAIPADQINVDLKKAGEVEGTVASNKSAIFEIFKEVNHSQTNMDGLMEQLNSGKKFNTHELMRLQIFAHQHTVTYELVSKFGEMANRAIQTPIQMQV